MSLSLFKKKGTKGANSTPFIRVNLITPELTGIPPRQVNAGFVLSIIGVLAITYAGMQHFKGVDALTQAEQTLSLIPSTPMAHLETVREHRKVSEQLEAAQAQLAGLNSALPVSRNISELLAEAVMPLPGIGSNYPQVVLTTISASINPPEELGRYGLKPSEARRVLLSVDLKGEADTSFVIPDALRAYQSNPHYATNFRGTSIEEGNYTFNLGLARLTPPEPEPREAQAEGESSS